MPAYPVDLGVVLTLAGAQLVASPSFAASAAIDGGRPPRFRFSGAIVGKTGTSISPVVVKLQASNNNDGTVTASYYDVESEDDSDQIAEAPLILHSYAVGSGVTVLFSLTVDGCYKHLRVLAQGAAAGATGDSVTVSAMAIANGPS